MILSRRSIIISLSIIVAALLAYGLFRIALPTNLKLAVAPSPATILLDGKKRVGGGSYHLSTGKHSLKASMNGFADFTRTFTIVDGQVTTLNIVLNPNSAAGRAYLKAHPTEEFLREQLSGTNFQSTNQQIVKNNPIVTLLPHVASDSTYRIDFGATDAKTNKTQLYITAVNNQAAQSAQDWITSKGYKISSLVLQTSIEPLLNHLPYKTTDFDLEPDFGSGTNGAPKLNIDATLYIPGAEANDSTASDQLKQEVLSYIRSSGVDPANYTITYTIQQG